MPLDAPLMNTLGPDTGSPKRPLAQALFPREPHQAVEHLHDLLGAPCEAGRCEELAVDDEGRNRAYLVRFQQLARLRDLLRNPLRGIGLNELFALDAVAPGPLALDLLSFQLQDFN